MREGAEHASSWQSHAPNQYGLMPTMMQGLAGLVLDAPPITTFCRMCGANSQLHGAEEEAPMAIQASLDGVSITGGILVCAEYFLEIGHYVLTDL